MRQAANEDARQHHDKVYANLTDTGEVVEIDAKHGARSHRSRRRSPGRSWGVFMARRGPSELPPLAHRHVVGRPVGFPGFRSVELQEQVAVRAELVGLRRYPEIRAVE